MNVTGSAKDSATGHWGAWGWNGFSRPGTLESRTPSCSGTSTRPSRAYHQALELIPEDAVSDRAVTHNQLGNAYSHAGDIDRALPHYREAIRYFELAGGVYDAARTRTTSR